MLEFWTSGGLPYFAPRKRTLKSIVLRVEQVLFGALGEMLGLALPCLAFLVGRHLHVS